MKRFATGFFDSEDGFSTIELILILEVLVTLVVLFKGQVIALLNRAFGEINNQAGKVY